MFGYRKLTKRIDELENSVNSLLHTIKIISREYGVITEVAGGRIWYINNNKSTTKVNSEPVKEGI